MTSRSRQASPTRFDFVAALATTIRPRDYQEELVDALERDLALAPLGSKFLVRLATGGGKRLVANEFLWRHVVADGGRALVVTKDWELLAQLASDLCQRHEGARAVAGFVGGSDGREAFRGIAERSTSAIVYTTIHTWAARRAVFEREAFDLVVIDELHWGEGATLYANLLEMHAACAVFVGFTATPRPWTKFKLVGRGVDFSELVAREVLAQPLVHPALRTNVTWDPQLSGPRGDIAATSLRTLAMSDARNELIVGTYREQQELFGKSLVFACDIGHAETLAKLFKGAGVRTGVIHSKMSIADRRGVLRSFAGGTLEVLVNVAIMTHGIDIPDIQTIFLTRPTCSDILYSQMVGRGARRAPGKTFFHIVDFVDATETFGIPIVRPDGFFGASEQHLRCPSIEEHEFAAAPIETVPSIAGYEELAGLEIQPNQTFGIEFEMTLLNADVGGEVWEAVAQRVLDALRAVVPTAEHPLCCGPQDNRVWNIKMDASCGWEVTTRILKGQAGLREVVDACRTMAPIASSLGLGVSVKTGTHVHLGWQPAKGALQRFLYLAAYYEPALVSLVSPSRARSAYCRSTLRQIRALVRAQLRPRDWVANWRRNTAVNLSHVGRGYRTVEIRLHNGTLDALKILTWISLWMRLLAAAVDVSVPIPSNPLRRLYRAPLCPGPRGDIRALCRHVGIAPALEEKLVHRRAEVGRFWLNDARHAVLAERLRKHWNPAVPGAGDVVDASPSGPSKPSTTLPLARRARLSPPNPGDHGHLTAGAEYAR